MPTGGPAAADGPPQFQLAHLVLTQPLDHVAPALGLTAEALTDRLIAAGYTVAAASQPLTEIARASGKSEADLALLMTGPNE